MRSKYRPLANELPATPWNGRGSPVQSERRRGFFVRCIAAYTVTSIVPSEPSLSPSKSVPLDNWASMSVSAFAFADSDCAALADAAGRGQATVEAPPTPEHPIRTAPALRICAYIIIDVVCVSNPIKRSQLLDCNSGMPQFAALAEG